MRLARFVPDRDDVLVVAASDAGTLFAWSIGWPSLLGRLEAATDACLTPTDRVNLLGEPADEALRQFAACRVKAGRPPTVPPQVTVR